MNPIEDVLSCPMDENNAGARTVGEYLSLLLLTLWEEEEEFKGKRPFGDSGWQYDVYVALSKQRLIQGLLLDSYGYVEVFSRKDQLAADDLIKKAIWHMRRA